MAEQLQIRRAALAAARRRSSARYAAEHVDPLTTSRLLSDGDADDLLARAYRLRRKKLARRVSTIRTGALLR
jgi:hypothetical protein